MKLFSIGARVAQTTYGVGTITLTRGTAIIPSYRGWSSLPRTSASETTRLSAPSDTCV